MQIALLVGVLALTGAAKDDPGFEVKVQASGLNWAVNWTKAVINSLQRLSGAKRVQQDDFNKGVATFVVSFDQPFAGTTADVKKLVGKYTVDKVEVKITARIAQKKSNWYAGKYQLVGSDDMLAKLAEYKKARKTLLVLYGLLKDEDPKAQQLELTKIAEVSRKGK